MNAVASAARVVPRIIRRMFFDLGKRMSPGRSTRDTTKGRLVAVAPTESSETHAVVCPGSPGAADTAANRGTASREQSSTPEPSKAPFRTRSSRNAIPPATESVCAPTPPGTTGHLSPVFVHPEKRQGARPCFPTTSAAENEIAGKVPEEPADHPDKAPSWEARCPAA